MIKRNGSTIRTILTAVVLVLLVYFIYLYNGVQSRLKNSEIMSEKLKRDRESLSSQLTDISLEKENIREKSQKDRIEIMSKFTELQSKYKMLQSQHQDMETEYTRIQQKLDKFMEDSKQKDANRNQEFMTLKQEKEMEIVKLKDQNANLFRENEQYKGELLSIKQQLQQQQLALQQERSESNVLRQQLQLARAMNMKNIQMNNQMDNGNLQFVHHNMQPQQQQQQILQQQQPILQQQHQMQPMQQQGILNDVQNGNVMGRILHQPPNNQFGIGQQQAVMPQEGIHNGLPAKPIEQQHFQIQPADGDHNPAVNMKVDNGKELDLQKQEVEQRKQQQENDHNQVQPPVNNEKAEDLNEKKELDEEEAEREHIFGMLNRRRYDKRNEPFGAEHPIVPPAMEGNDKPINKPQVNVEDKLAGRDSANENHQFFEEKVPQEMLMGQNVEEPKDGDDQMKKSHKGNKRQKMNKNRFDNVLLGDEKELQVQHPNNMDGGNKKGLNNDDQYYDEEEDDTYQ